MTTTTTIKLYSLSLAGHYRAGQYISPKGTDVDVSGFSLRTLEQIDSDVRLVRPEAWVEIIAAARAADDDKPDDAKPAKAKKAA